MSEIGRASRKEAQVLGWVVILGLLIAVVWYVIASDYSYDGITGTYVQRSTTEDSTLILKNDQHFEQEVTHDGVTQRAHGTWRRLGEGRIVLSPEFITLPSVKRRSDGEVDGEVIKTFGLFPQIVLDAQPGGPIFRRHFLR
jgi:hypothetical protein